MEFSRAYEKRCLQELLAESRENEEISHYEHVEEAHDNYKNFMKKC